MKPATNRKLESSSLVARNILKAEMVRRSISFEMLSEKLADRGYVISAKNLNAKVNRGSFSAAFLLDSLDALGVHEIKIGDL